MRRAEIITLTTGAFAENCFIVLDPESRDAVIVDPGEDAELFLRRMETERALLRAIWLTHAHVDHVQGVKGVVDRMRVPIYLHPDDQALYEGAEAQGAWLGVRVEAPPPVDHALAAGDRLQVGKLQFEVRHVPGHSPGSVAFVGEGAAIVGDALFQGSIGRTDLPGGDMETLLTSIREQLLTLPDDTVVYTGHGPATTIGRERASNPFLTGTVGLV